ncbi:MAG: hypothetical protein ACXQTQ_04145 [Candidatus Hecatellaceae archaeon]
MGRCITVRLRKRVIRVRWKCKRRSVVKTKKYLRWWLQVPAGVEVSDLVGLPLKAYRDGAKLVFELVEGWQHSPLEPKETLKT